MLKFEVHYTNSPHVIVIYTRHDIAHRIGAPACISQRTMSGHYFWYEYGKKIKC